MNRQVFADLRDEYNLQFSSFKPITTKAFRVKCNDENCYFVKKSNLYAQDKYQFLYNQGINNILYPIKNKRGNFVTNRNRENYYVMDYVKNFDIVGEIKAVNMSEELSKLHFNTYFKRQLSVEFSRNKMEEIYEYLQYKFNLLESYVRTIETRPFDEYSITILKNYHYILDTKKLMAQFHKKIVSDIKSRKSVNYSFIHNNPKLNHLLTTRGNHFLTSIERSKVGIPSLDMAKLYLETEDLNVDIRAFIISYFEKYEDEFYINYFYFLVLLFYIKGIIIYDKDYVSSQSFLYATSSIKKFLDLFDLKEDKTE